MTNTVSNNTLPPVFSAIWARTDLIMEDKMEGARHLFLIPSQSIKMKRRFAVVAADSQKFPKIAGTLSQSILIHYTSQIAYPTTKP